MQLIADTAVRQPDVDYCEPACEFHQHDQSSARFAECSYASTGFWPLSEADLDHFLVKDPNGTIVDWNRKPSTWSPEVHKSVLCCEAMWKVAPLALEIHFARTTPTTVHPGFWGPYEVICRPRDLEARGLCRIDLDSPALQFATLAQVLAETSADFEQHQDFAELIDSLLSVKRALSIRQAIPLRPSDLSTGKLLLREVLSSKRMTA